MKLTFNWKKRKSTHPHEPLLDNEEEAHHVQIKKDEGSSFCPCSPLTPILLLLGILAVSCWCLTILLHLKMNESGQHHYVRVLEEWQMGKAVESQGNEPARCQVVPVEYR